LAFSACSIALCMSCSSLNVDRSILLLLRHWLSTCEFPIDTLTCILTTIKFNLRILTLTNTLQSNSIQNTKSKLRTKNRVFINLLWLE
jgi:hypothetical protein